MPAKQAHRTSATAANSEAHGSRPGMRLDKWLWAARFFKTRGLAAETVDKGRVTVNGLVAKPSRELRPDDRVELLQAGVRRTVTVLRLELQRGPATAAQQLYAETADSIAARDAAAVQRRQAAEPALAIAHGRPTKRDRRQMAEWDRWSASADPAD